MAQSVFKALDAGKPIHLAIGGFSTAVDRTRDAVLANGADQAKCPICLAWWKQPENPGRLCRSHPGRADEFRSSR